MYAKQNYFASYFLFNYLSGTLCSWVILSNISRVPVLPRLPRSRNPWISLMKISATKKLIHSKCHLSQRTPYFWGWEIMVRLDFCLACSFVLCFSIKKHYSRGKENLQKVGIKVSWSNLNEYMLDLLTFLSQNLLWRVGTMEAKLYRAI